MCSILSQVITLLLTQEAKGPGQKLQYSYTGHYVVHSLPSLHLVKVRNLENNEVLKSQIHLNRLKMAYVRQPNPSSYFLPSLATHEINPKEQIEIIKNQSASHVDNEGSNSIYYQEINT